MGQQIPITTSFDLPDGRTVTIETGKLIPGRWRCRRPHGQYHALCFRRFRKEAREGQPFFPLSVDYQENLPPLPHSRKFLQKRKLNHDSEVLICRLVGRAIRPFSRMVT